MRISDWSSDVCSSDLPVAAQATVAVEHPGMVAGADAIAKNAIGPGIGVGARFDRHHRIEIGLGHWPDQGSHLTLCTHVNQSCRRCDRRSEEHTSELKSLMRISYAVICIQKKIHSIEIIHTN